MFVMALMSDLNKGLHEYVPIVLEPSLTDVQHSAHISIV